MMQVSMDLMLGFAKICKSCISVHIELDRQVGSLSIKYLDPSCIISNDQLKMIQQYIEIDSRYNIGLSEQGPVDDTQLSEYCISLMGVTIYYAKSILQQYK